MAVQFFVTYSKANVIHTILANIAAHPQTTAE